MQVENSIARVQETLPRLYALAQGGTAVGTGLNTKVGFAEKFAKAVADDTGADSPRTEKLIRSCCHVHGVRWDAWSLNSQFGPT